MPAVEPTNDAVVQALHAALDRAPTESETTVGVGVMTQMVLEGKTEYTGDRWFEWRRRVFEVLGMPLPG